MKTSNQASPKTFSGKLNLYQGNPSSISLRPRGGEPIYMKPTPAFLKRHGISRENPYFDCVIVTRRGKTSMRVTVRKRHKRRKITDKDFIAIREQIAKIPGIVLAIG